MLRLHSNGEPSGRCLLLAHKLHQVTGMNGTESCHVAERLFACQHKRESPAVVSVANPALVEELVALCAEFGISVETVSDTIQRPQ